MIVIPNIKVNLIMEDSEKRIQKMLGNDFFEEMSIDENISSIVDSMLELNIESSDAENLIKYTCLQLEIMLLLGVHKKEYTFDKKIFDRIKLLNYDAKKKK